MLWCRIVHILTNVSLVKSAAWGLIPVYEKFLGQLMLLLLDAKVYDNVSGCNIFIQSYVLRGCTFGHNEGMPVESVF